MSHGSTDRAEPNFTPLLDLVLQLVMFFMLCANFVMEQTAEEIQLPKALAAKVGERNEDIFYLNVNQDGKVLLTPDQREPDRDTLDNEIQVREYMKRRAEQEKRRTGKEKPEAVLVLRVDRRTFFEKTYEIMRACRQAGYEKVQLRVERSNEG